MIYFLFFLVVVEAATIFFLFREHSKLEERWNEFNGHLDYRIRMIEDELGLIDRPMHRVNVLRREARRKKELEWINEDKELPNKPS